MIQSEWFSHAEGSSLWMEVLQKLVAVALVSTVPITDGFRISLGITLGMAATSALVQAYVRPQVRFHPNLESSRGGGEHGGLWPGAQNFI